MKSIIFCGLILALGMSCNADEDLRACSKKVHDAMCKPDTLDDTLAGKLMACAGEISADDKAKAAKAYEVCGEKGKDDAKAYTKITNPGHEAFVVWACSKNFHDCLKEKVKALSSEEIEKIKGDMKAKAAEYKKMIDCKMGVLGIKP